MKLCKESDFDGLLQLIRPGLLDVMHFQCGFRWVGDVCPQRFSRLDGWVFQREWMQPMPERMKVKANSQHSSPEHHLHLVMRFGATDHHRGLHSEFSWGICLYQTGLAVVVTTSKVLRRYSSLIAKLFSRIMRACRCVKTFYITAVRLRLLDAIIVAVAHRIGHKSVRATNVCMETGKSV